MWELNPPRQIGSLEYQPLYEYSMDGFILRASIPPTLRPTSIFFLSLFFFLTLIGLILFYANSSLYVQPIISEAKTTRAFINGCAPYGSRLYSNDQTGQWDCAYPFRAYLRGALYFTKALKPSQFLVIDLTLRALTQPKTRAFTTATEANSQRSFLLDRVHFTLRTLHISGMTIAVPAVGLGAHSLSPLLALLNPALQSSQMQVAIKEVLDNGYFRFLCIIVRLQMTSHISSTPIRSVTPVVVYRKSILSRTALIIQGRIRARPWVQRAVTLRRREVYETSLRTSSLCQVKGALRTPAEQR